MEYTEVTMGFGEETLDNIDRLHALLGGDNKTDTVVKAIIIALEICDTLRHGGAVEVISPDGKHTELRLDASVMQG